VQVEHKNLTGRHKMKVPGYGKQEIKFGVLTSMDSLLLMYVY
jgi:hypothetical protein